MVETNTLLIGGAVLVFLLVIFIIPWGGKCNCSEAYQTPRNAQFTVNRPKYNVQPTYPVKSDIAREGWIIPSPTKAQTITGDNVNGGFSTPTSHPMMGGLQGEISMGVSVPGRNTSVTLSGNGAGNLQATEVWRTVI